MPIVLSLYYINQETSVIRMLLLVSNRHFHTASASQFQVGWDSVVSIATLYELDSSLFKIQEGWGFSRPSRKSLWPTQFPDSGYWIFHRCKAARVWHWSSTPILFWGQRKSRDIPLLPICAFKVCYRAKPTFLFLVISESKMCIYNVVRQWD